MFNGLESWYSCLLLLFFFCSGIYHQFDTFIYPPPLKGTAKAPKGWIAKKLNAVKEAAKGWWHGGVPQGQEYDETAETMNVPDKVVLLSNNELRSKCLQHYLSDYLTVLHQGIPPQLVHLTEFVDFICHIYDCVKNLKLHDGRRGSEPYVWIWRSARDVGSV